MNFQENVIIKDISVLNKKIQQIKEDGVDKLHVVSDFDKTLNKEFTKTGKYKSAISLLRDGGYLENDYPKKAYALYDKYHPIEIDLTISFEEKKEKMNEWWNEHILLISESKMHKDLVFDVISKSNMELREGADIFFKNLLDNNIPLLIFSSGIGDFISCFLEKENLLFKNTHVVSNFFDWDENGFAKPNYKDKTIHMLSKNETELKNTDYFRKIENRKNVIVIGDSIEDLDMVSSLENNVVISIGFLNSDVEKKLDIYKEKFDVVIINDGSFKPVIEILNEVIN